VSILILLLLFMHVGYMAEVQILLLHMHQPMTTCERHRLSDIKRCAVDNILIEEPVEECTPWIGCMCMVL
jgi:hypothetical protein